MKGKANQQRLTPQEEKALAAWVSASTVVGHLVQYDFIREMAEHLIKQCIGDDEIIPQLIASWVPSFLHRHRYLKTTMTHAIEMSRIKNVTKEQVLHFNEEFHRLIKEHNIRL